MEPPLGLGKHWGRPNLKHADPVEDLGFITIPLAESGDLIPLVFSEDRGL